MVKHERNIYCTVCGKTYVDFIAAQNHTRKHGVGQQHPVSQLPGNVGIQSTAGPEINISDPRAAYSSPSPQRAPPNPTVPVRPNTTGVAPRIARVVTRPETNSRVGGQFATMSKTKMKLYCLLCPHLPKFGDRGQLKRHKKRWHLKIHKCMICSAAMGRTDLEKHLREVHGTSWRAMKKLSKKPAKTTDNKEKAAPASSSAESSDDEGELPFEVKGHLLLEDGGQSSSEGEQRTPPEGKGKQPVRDNRQSSDCESPTDAGVPTLDAKARKIRGFNKKLRAIGELKEKVKKGERLQATQLKKINKEPEIRRALAVLSVS